MQPSITGTSGWTHRVRFSERVGIVPLTTLKSMAFLIMSIWTAKIASYLGKSLA